MKAAVYILLFMVSVSARAVEPHLGFGDRYDWASMRQEPRLLPAWAASPRQRTFVEGAPIVLKISYYHPGAGTLPLFEEGCRFKVAFQINDEQPVLSISGVSFNHPVSLAPLHLKQYQLELNALYFAQGMGSTLPPGKYTVHVAVISLKTRKKWNGTISFEVNSLANAGYRVAEEHTGLYKGLHRLVLNKQGDTVFHQLAAGTPIEQRHYSTGAFPWVFAQQPLRRKYGIPPYGDKSINGLMSLIKEWDQQVKPDVMEKVLSDRLLWRQLPMRPLLKVGSSIQSASLTLDPEDRGLVLLKSDRNIVLLSLPVQDQVSMFQMKQVLMTTYASRGDPPQRYARKIELPPKTGDVFLERLKDIWTQPVKQGLVALDALLEDTELQEPTRKKLRTCFMRDPNRI